MLKTIIHEYHLSLDNPADKEAYKALSAKLRAEGRECFKSLGAGSHYRPDLDGLVIELETVHLFDNQWNTAPIPGVSDIGLRVFDWAEDAIYVNGRENVTLKRGHWIELTEEMIAARASRVACGYCGKQYAASEEQDIPGFCGACCDSAYLTEKDLPLTRLFPVTVGIGRKLKPLTDAERAVVLPRFTDAQLRGRKARSAAAEAKQRAKVAAIVKEAKAKAEKKIAAAAREQAGFQWLLDRGFWGLLDNVIYYDHTDTFHFGWQGPGGLPDSAVSELLDVISEFPVPYEISTDPKGVHGGRRLSGGQG